MTFQERSHFQNTCGSWKTETDNGSGDMLVNPSSLSNEVHVFPCCFWLLPRPVGHLRCLQDPLTLKVDLWKQGYRTSRATVMKRTCTHSHSVYTSMLQWPLIRLRRMPITGARAVPVASRRKRKEVTKTLERPWLKCSCQKLNRFLSSLFSAE